MTPLRVFHWFMAAAIAALLSAAVQPAAADRMGGGVGGRGGMVGHGGIRGHLGMGMAPHFFSGRGSAHAFGHFDHRHDFAFRHHEFNRFRDRDFDRDDRFFHDNRFFDRDDFFFRHHNRFLFVFDFVSFGFPVDFPIGFPGWYPAYYRYPYDYAYASYGSVYDRQYWTDLAVSVQSELAQRGYYHGAIDGEISSDSRQAIRAFQEAQGLPVTGMIDAKLLQALGIKYKTAYSQEASSL
jgi:Putative peptidoglycan binding domain